MGKPHVISALVRKRAYLAGNALDADDDKRTAILADIAHLDRVLVMFGYRDDPNTIPPRRRHVYSFKRNELPRLMRQIGEGTNREVALRIIALKGWDASDRTLVNTVRESVKSQRGWQKRRTLPAARN